MKTLLWLQTCLQKPYYALLQIGYYLRFRYARTSMYACVAFLSNNPFSLKPSEFFFVRYYTLSLRAFLLKRVLKTLLVKSAAIISLSVLATGCAMPAATENMIIHPAASKIPVSQKYKGAMAVRDVTGGEETNPLWTSQVDNASFKSALQQSLAEMGYDTPEGKKPRYFIDADLRSLDQPFIGLDFDVSANVVYNVEKNGVKTKYPINAVGTASVSDAFIAVERLKIANERAIKENIKYFFTTIAKPE